LGNERGGDGAIYGAIWGKINFRDGGGPKWKTNLDYKEEGRHLRRESATRYQRSMVEGQKKIRSKKIGRKSKTRHWKRGVLRSKRWKVLSRPERPKLR